LIGSGSLEFEFLVESLVLLGHVSGVKNNFGEFALNISQRDGHIVFLCFGSDSDVAEILEI
jgi:hypothetical protein